MSNKSKLLLILIVFLSALLRFWRLDSYPALNADEAAIGYNAYSLIQTGKDEHGNPWPIHFQSFNDYKPGLYFYLVLPFVKVLGLTELAVRIPGALLGVGTVIVLYFLVRELFRNERLAVLSSIFLTISPWHIHFSRGGWEVNVATFFMTLGLWLFLKGLKNSKFFLISILFFVLSLYTYHALRVVVPLLILGLGLIYSKEIKANLKRIVASGLIALVLLLPLGLDFAKGEARSRVAGVGLFADPGPLSRINEQRGNHGNFEGLGARAIHNKAVNYSLAFVQNWAQHFSGEFLFVSGDAIQRNKVPETGQMYLIDFVLLMIALAAVARGSNRGWAAILLWLLLAPTAAALTFQSPHALRAQNMVIPLVVISAYGLLTILKWMGGFSRFKVLGYIAIGVVMVWSFARYQHMYWVHMAKEYPFSSQYGVRELLKFVSEEAQGYNKIIVTDRYDQPYILFAFYLKYPPQKFQENHTLTPRDKFGFSTVTSFDKYEFMPINYDSVQPQNPGCLIVGTDGEIPPEANIIKKVYGQNGYLYFEAVAN